MKYLIAVASYDGANIDLHFGHTGTFSIVEVTDNKEWDFIGEREVSPGCNGECDHNRIYEVGESLKDCKYALSAKIGPGAASILRNLGIIALEIEAPIDYAIEKLMIYDQRKVNANR
ncbi:MAG: hydrogenase [Butyrivibrio sp.]|nr:hydrogenase [Butyrivibrio sp.]